MTRRKKDDQSKIGGQRPVITVDYDLYAHFLEDSDLTEEQKRDYLQAFWNIICEFVALGIGVHPAQQAQNTCGKLFDTPSEPPLLGADALEWMDQNQVDIFNDAAEGITPDVAERIPE